jgi:hypothetical protein
MGSEIVARVDGALLRVTINRPEKRNALSRAALARLKRQAAARKLGLPRSEADARDRELMARAWSHPDHWAAAKDVLDRGPRD